MPLQNRVTPFADIARSSARGLFMGNRGILHDENQELGAARWRNERWIVCTLEPRPGRPKRRVVMAPGRYTELFFLDEATALAAGHRPCAHCRRDALRHFASVVSGEAGAGPLLSAREIDRSLHEARLTKAGAQRTTTARFADLPDGAFVQRDGTAWLVSGGQLLRWSFDGYSRAEAGKPGEILTVLTPLPTLDALRQGYRPVLHTSANR